MTGNLVLEQKKSLKLVVKLNCVFIVGLALVVLEEDLEFYELLLAGIEVLVLLNQGLGVEVVAVGELEVSFDLGRVRFGHRVRQHFQTAVEGVDVLLV